MIEFDRWWEANREPVRDRYDFAEAAFLAGQASVEQRHEQEANALCASFVERQLQWEQRVKYLDAIAIELQVTCDKQAKRVAELESRLELWSKATDIAVADALKAQAGERYLNGGTRYKVGEHQGNGAIMCLPVKMIGEWVALVEATDDCHMKLTTPNTPAAEPVNLPENWMYEEPSLYTHTAAERRVPPDIELIEFAAGEQFFLFASEDEVLDIMRTTLQRYGNAAPRCRAIARTAAEIGKGMK